MKVAKKVRLLQKDAKGKLFVKSDNCITLRDRSVVPDDVIKESELSYPETGILWIEDKEATKERNELKNPKKTTVNKSKK